MKIPASGELHGRAVTEWVGKTADAKVPDEVRLRVLLRHNRRCALSGQKIRPTDVWHLDHITPLKDGGKHRESNFQPALDVEHVKKTAEEAAARAKVKRIAKKFHGISQPKRKIPSRPFSVKGYVPNTKYVERFE